MFPCVSITSGPGGPYPPALRLNWYSMVSFSVADATTAVPTNASNTAVTTNLVLIHFSSEYSDLENGPRQILRHQAVVEESTNRGPLWNSNPGEGNSEQPIIYITNLRTIKQSTRNF